MYQPPNLRCEIPHSSIDPLPIPTIFRRGCSNRKWMRGPDEFLMVELMEAFRDSKSILRCKWYADRTHSYERADEARIRWTWWQSKSESSTACFFAFHIIFWVLRICPSSSAPFARVTSLQPKSLGWCLRYERRLSDLHSWRCWRIMRRSQSSGRTSLSSSKRRAYVRRGRCHLREHTRAWSRQAVLITSRVDNHRSRSSLRCEVSHPSIDPLPIPILWTRSLQSRVDGRKRLMDAPEDPKSIVKCKWSADDFHTRQGVLHLTARKCQAYQGESMSSPEIYPCLTRGSCTNYQ